MYLSGVIGSAFPTDGAAASQVGNVVAHGVVGGAASVAQDGSFGSGFLAGAVSAAAAPYVPRNPVAGTVVSAIIGGTVSEIGGGKFANGAVTGAFGYLFNFCMHTGCGLGVTADLANAAGMRKAAELEAGNRTREALTSREAQLALSAIGVVSGVGSTVSIFSGFTGLAGWFSGVGIISSGASVAINPSLQNNFGFALDVGGMALSNVVPTRVFMGAYDLSSTAIDTMFFMSDVAPASSTCQAPSQC